MRTLQSWLPAAWVVVSTFALVAPAGAAEPLDEGDEKSWGRRLSSSERKDVLGKLRDKRWYRLTPDGERLVIERHCKLGKQPLIDTLKLEGTSGLAWNSESNHGKRADIERVFEARDGRLVVVAAEARKKPSVLLFRPGPAEGGVAHFEAIGSDRIELAGPWLETTKGDDLGRWADVHPVVEANCTARRAAYDEAYLRGIGFSPNGSHFAFVDETYRCVTGPMGHACGPGLWTRLRVIDVLKNDFVGPAVEAGGPKSRGDSTGEVMAQAASLLAQHGIDEKQGRKIDPDGVLAQVAFEHDGKRYLVRSKARRTRVEGCWGHQRLLDIELVRRATGEVVTLQRDKRSSARWRRCTRDYGIYAIYVHPGGDRPVVAIEIWTQDAKRPGMFVTGALE